MIRIIKNAELLEVKTNGRTCWYRLQDPQLVALLKRERNVEVRQCWYDVIEVEEEPVELSADRGSSSVVKWYILGERIENDADLRASVQISAAAKLTEIEKVVLGLQGKNYETRADHQVR